MRVSPEPPESASLDELHEQALTPEGIPIPNFAPWRAKRERVGGWAPDVQRAFICELTRIGSVGAAARSVGMTARSAYQLRDKAGAYPPFSLAKSVWTIDQALHIDLIETGH